MGVEPTGGADPVDLDAWLDNEGLPPLFTDGPVASCAQWTAVPRDAMTSNAPMDLKCRKNYATPFEHTRESI